MFEFEKFKKNDKKYSKLPLIPLAVIVVSVVVYFAAQFLAAFFVALYPALQGRNVEEIFDMLVESNIAQFGFAIIAQAVTFLLIVQYVKKKGVSLKSLGWKKPVKGDFILAIQGFGVYFVSFVAAVILISNLVPVIDMDQAQELGFSRESTGWMLVLIYVAVVIMPSIVEEFSVRGFMFTGLRTKLNFFHAALLSSLLFGAAHLQWGLGESLLWMAAVDTAILGFVMAYMRESSGSLVSAILLHGIKNSIAFVSIFVIGVS